MNRSQYLTIGLLIAMIWFASQAKANPLDEPRSAAIVDPISDFLSQIFGGKAVMTARQDLGTKLDGQIVLKVISTINSMQSMILKSGAYFSAIVC